FRNLALGLSAAENLLERLDAQEVCFLVGTTAASRVPGRATCVPEGSGIRSSGEACCNNSHYYLVTERLIDSEAGNYVGVRIGVASYELHNFFVLAQVETRAAEHVDEHSPGTVDVGVFE